MRRFLRIRLYLCFLTILLLLGAEAFAASPFQLLPKTAPGGATAHYIAVSPAGEALLIYRSRGSNRVTLAMVPAGTRSIKEIGSFDDFGLLYTAANGGQVGARQISDGSVVLWANYPSPETKAVRIQPGGAVSSYPLPQGGTLPPAIVDVLESGELIVFTEAIDEDSFEPLGPDLIGWLAKLDGTREQIIFERGMGGAVLNVTRWFRRGSYLVYSMNTGEGNGTFVLYDLAARSTVQRLSQDGRKLLALTGDGRLWLAAQNGSVLQQIAAGSSTPTVEFQTTAGDEEFPFAGPAGTLIAGQIPRLYRPDGGEAQLLCVSAPLRGLSINPERVQAAEGGRVLLYTSSRKVTASALNSGVDYNHYLLDLTGPATAAALPNYCITFSVTFGKGCPQSGIVHGSRPEEYIVPLTSGRCQGSLTVRDAATEAPLKGKVSVETTTVKAPRLLRAARSSTNAAGKIAFTLKGGGQGLRFWFRAPVNTGAKKHPATILVSTKRR